jgi:hypothetical protein
MARKPSLEFHAMGVVDGKRVDIEGSRDLGSKLGAQLSALASCKDDSMRAMCKATGIDPKTQLAYGDWEGVPFENEGDLLENANLRICNLTNTVWKNSSIKGALLEAANFTGATGLTEEDFAGAYINNETILPKDIDRARVLALHKALDMPAPPPFNRTGREGMIEIPVTVTVTDVKPPTYKA